ncbi:carboxylesterase/lipase family protein [Phenylobacterium terrae]|uniref:Carboxylic ester hydrolase n=1 Tax=Phenylobacterium terrae TaxID=2665495 RepID=A0ABW4N332_9CAUL
MTDADLTAPAAGVSGPVKVETRSGVLVGAREGGLVRFLGVPYARPPVGELRWRAPQPLSWTGERAATAFGPPGLQRTPSDGRPNGAGVSGASSEDCLYLNVWAPAEARGAPVMVWIYGGGGTMGSGSVPSYDGSAFARDGVILVTINYRLGALGGFAHPALTRATPAGEGLANYHLLDAMAALRWVKDNAAAFGGDPGNVTVFGESAGATITANLLTSPMARGLFDKAIVQSTGSLPTPGTPLAAAEAFGARLASALGLPGAEATVEQLRALPGEAVIGVERLGAGLRTVIDGRVKTQSIMDAFAAGEAIDVPMIIGTNSDEGRLSGTQRVATYAMSGAPVWQYFFDYVPDWRRAEQPNGAAHAAEIPYVFDTLRRDRRIGGRATDKDQSVADYIHACWVAFAKLPAGARAIEGPGGFVWPARTEANDRTVAIFQERPSLGKAQDLRSPPNGAPPGPTSRDEE